MAIVRRVLDPDPVLSLGDYERSGGGSGLRAASEAGPEATIAVVTASGLRGRGGAGFPTGVKWQSVTDNLSADLPASVVVNAAEGEPGTFKDRSILRSNPYRVLEGALIAAVAIHADQVVVAIKQQFRPEVARLMAAIAEIGAAGWAPHISIDVVEGPSEYLFGEETALLEVVGGRQPFPRLAPPWRRGIDDIGAPNTGGGPGDALAADNEMAGPGGTTTTPPALVDNVETLANVALILAQGPEWFREVGTDRSPGTIVCTVTGSMARHGVEEFAMGTPLREVLMAIGDQPLDGPITAVLSGVSNAILPGDLLDTPLTYEDLIEAGSGLGTAGFIVFDREIDPLAVAHGVSRFLSVESCGQCSPCKQDGKVVTAALDRLATVRVDGDEQRIITESLLTIEIGARCFLATEHRLAVESILRLFPDAVTAEHVAGDPYHVAELADIVDGQAQLDSRQITKQPDWTHDPEDSGQAPAARLDQRSGEASDTTDTTQVD